MKETSKVLFERADTFKRMFEINPDHPTAKKTYESLVARANELLTAELKIKGMKFEAKHEGSEWYELIKKQYPITQEDGKFVLRSEAKNWEDQKFWEFDDRYLALAKVEQLVAWLADHRKRGRGDTDKDIARITEKLGA